MKPWHLAANNILEYVPNFKPQLGLILGSGLTPVADAIEDSRTIVFEDIAGFPPLTVRGHSGKITLGYLNGLPVACLQGRSHYYEGYTHISEDLSFEEMMTPIRTLRLLGCKALLSTNSSGSLREEIIPGQIVSINDHINFQFNNPLVGTPDGEFGSPFVGMEDAYDSGLRQLIQQAAKTAHIQVSEGIYIGVLGPSFETPAEIRAFRMWGADVVGMSTIPEVITARHCGLQVAVLSVITNMAAGMSEQKLSHDVTLRGAEKGIDNLIRVILEFVKQYAAAQK